ncbi:MAG: hypothetical protein PVJ39_10480 [Gammaproteobacteria bacterium]
MKALPEQTLELKTLNTGALLFAGVAILVALAYIDVSHMGTTGYVVTPQDIADTYYGPGLSVNTLVGLAHIHMLGLLPLFWIIGYIFIHSTISLKWRIFWSIMPYVAFFIDVTGWFLTHYYEIFVYQVIIGGGVFVASLSVMIVVSLYQLWITPWKMRRSMA